MDASCLLGNVNTLANIAWYWLILYLMLANIVLTTCRCIIGPHRTYFTLNCFATCMNVLFLNFCEGTRTTIYQYNSKEKYWYIG